MTYIYCGSSIVYDIIIKLFLSSYCATREFQSKTFDSFYVQVVHSVKLSTEYLPITQNNYKTTYILWCSCISKLCQKFSMISTLFLGNFVKTKHFEFLLLQKKNSFSFVLLQIIWNYRNKQNGNHATPHLLFVTIVPYNVKQNK